jgi:hypothetical protein
MGHRTVKRVPLDFDAPLNEVWAGYMMPDDLYHLIRVSSPSEILGGVLRAMEREGEVDRTRHGYHKWGLIR